ncbi:MAG: hypothetical protein L6R43_00990 [Planctomycetes bacterium]|nr:hypothetical protein [Planctomycetota bacterium]
MRLAAAVLPLLLAAGAAAQDAAKPAAPPREEFPVGDLVLASREGAPVDPVSILPWSTAGGQSASGMAGGFLLPVEEEPGRRVLLEMEQLQDLLGLLVGGDDLPLTPCGGGILLAPAARAAEVRGALDRLRAAGPGPLAASVVLEEEDAGGWRVRLSAAEPIRPGVRAVFAVAEDRTFLADYDVELAQDSQLHDPVLLTQRTGASLDLRVSPLPGGGAAVVEAIARVSAALPPERAEGLHPDMGHLDRGVVAGAQAALLFRAEPGVETVHAWQARDGRSFRLRTTLRWAPPPADAGEPVLLWSPVLAWEFTSRTCPNYVLRPSGAEADENRPRFGKAEEDHRPTAEDRLLRVAERLEGGAEFDGEVTESGLLVLSGKGAAAAARELRGSMDREFRSHAVEVEARQAGDKERLLFRASGPLVSGTMVNFLSGEARNYVQDWDIEVAQGAWIPDPIVDCLQAGDYLNLRLVDAGDGTPFAVDLDFQMALFEGFEPVDMPLLDAMDRPGGSPSGAPTGPPRRGTYRVEKPTVREVRIAGRYPLAADGTVAIRRSAPGFLGSGREVVLTVKVARP